MRARARELAEDALKALERVLNDPNAPARAQLAAAIAILDRGYGKPTQHVQPEVSILDRLDGKQLTELLAVLKQLEEQEQTTAH